MNVYDLINVQLQLSLFRNKPESQYSERELPCGRTLCWSQKKDNLAHRFLKPEYPFKFLDLLIVWKWCQRFFRQYHLVQIDLLCFVSLCQIQILLSWSLWRFVTTWVVCDELVMTVFLSDVITALSQTCQP